MTRIVLVDADDERRRAVRGVLSEAEEGFDVEAVADADDAVAAVRRRPADCVVASYRVGEGDAADLCARLVDDLPVVVYVDAMPERVAGEVVAAGATRYLRCHGDYGRIATAVAEVLADGPDPADQPIPESLKERAIDEAPIGITIADATRVDDPLIFVNEAYERLTGYDGEAVLGHNCRLLQGPDTDEDAIGRLRRAVEAAEPVTVELRNYRKDGSPFWNEVDVAPIRGDDGEVTHYVGFQRDVTARKEAERALERRAAELERERERLDHLLDRLNGLLGEVTHALVDANTRTAVEQGVLDELVAPDQYAGAWLGRPAPGTGRIEPVATSGVAPDPEAIPADDPGPDDPIGRAHRDGAVEVACDVETLTADLHEAAMPPDCEAVAAIPVRYRDRTYGVAAVYATEPILTDREAPVLAAVGRATGYGIDAVESKRLLNATDTVEIAVEVDGTDAPIPRVSRRAGCRLHSLDAVLEADGRASAHFVLASGDRAALEDAVAADPDVDSVSVVTEFDDRCLVEFVLEGGLVHHVLDLGERLLELEVEAGTGRLAAELATDVDARSFVDALQERYDGIRFESKRHRERSISTRHQFVETVRERLTERQHDALRTAYLAGYFDDPRRATGDDLADSMGISRATFHQHLRASQRKLLDELFETDAPTIDR